VHSMLAPPSSAARAAATSPTVAACNSSSSIITSASARAETVSGAPPRQSSLVCGGSLRRQRRFQRRGARVKQTPRARRTQRRRASGLGTNGCVDEGTPLAAFSGGKSLHAGEYSGTGRHLKVKRTYGGVRWRAGYL
jgi:hypothetical protein